MRSVGVGDLAYGFRNTLQQAQLKSNLGRLSQELASGQRSDLRTGVGNDVVRFASLDAKVTTLNAYGVAAKEAALFTETAQMALGQITELTTDLAPSLISAGTTATEPGVSVNAMDARSNFETVIARLNARVGERSVFAGAEVSGAALASAETMIAELTTAIGGLTTVTDVETAVEVWFDAGGGFDTLGYLGSTADLAAFALSEGETAPYALRADNQAMRDILKGYAMAALVSDGLFSGDMVSRAGMLERAGERLITSNYQMSQLRAELGVTEGQIDTAIVRNSAEVAAMEIARSNLVEIDPYKTATDLQAAEIQLETLYTVTARLSRLSLVDFLR